MKTFDASFEHAVSVVLRHEGGFVQHASDPGGATHFGITRATLARSRGHPVAVDDVRRLTRQEAVAIYRRLYWDVLQAEELPPGLALAAFDLAVHSGPPRAARMLQSVLGVEADGVIGPVTLAAAREAEASQAIVRLTRMRLRFLRSLAAWPVFGRGWQRRVIVTERESLRLASLTSID